MEAAQQQGCDINIMKAQPDLASSPVVCMHLRLAAGVLDLREVLVLNQASIDVALRD